MDENTFRMIQTISIVVQTFALIMGVGWAYFRLRKERSHYPHLELDIETRFFESTDGFYLVEFQLIAHNKGFVRQKFSSILLRVRGIANNQPISFWPGNEPRVEFPLTIIDKAQVVPRGYNYYFVEPGVEQMITYVTKIPSSAKYILAHARFEYNRFTPHSAERVFEVKTSGHQNGSAG